MVEIKGSSPLGVILGVGVTFVLVVVVLVGAVKMLSTQASGSGATATLQWSAWSPPDRSFSIDFPGLPAPKTKPAVGTTFPSIVSYQLATPDGTELAITVLEIDPGLDVADPAPYVNGGARGYAGAAGGAMERFEPGEFAGMPSARFIVTGAKGYEHQAILFVGRHRVFIIAILTPIGQQPDVPMFERFRDSFRITG